MKKLLMWGLTAAVLSLLGVCCGASFIAPACFWNEDGLDPIVELRLLRVLAAWVVGGSLALAGMVFQAVLRNPLAEPFTLGLSGGAGVGAALAFVIGLRTCGLFLVQLSAWLGAIAVLALVLLVSRGGARGSNSLLLSGVIAGTIASSLLMYLVSAAQVEELAGLTWWMLGDLQAVDPDLLLLQGAVVVVAAVVLRRHAAGINALSLGDDSAFFLGFSPRSLSVLLVLTGALLAAGTIALCGIIGFCGLIVPHIVRRCCGSDHRRIVLDMLLCGGGFLLLCDLCGRMLFPDRELPIGVTTAWIGGPVFLWLLNRRRSDYDA